MSMGLEEECGARGIFIGVGERRTKTRKSLGTIGVY